ncbi:MAG: hypothetical protein AB7O59_05210 [Pirellulales bacterium]
MAHDSPLKPPAPRDDETEWVVVESQSFVDFDRWMDGELDRLIEQWVHLAAPNAKRFDRTANRFGR